jgi:hypothetical protein
MPEEDTTISIIRVMPVTVSSRKFVHFRQRRQASRRPVNNDIPGPRDLREAENAATVNFKITRGMSALDERCVTLWVAARGAPSNQKKCPA